MLRHCDEERRSNLAQILFNHNNQRYLRSIKIMKHRIKFGMVERSLVSHAELDSAS
jgi:hypothetical protein